MRPKLISWGAFAITLSLAMTLYAQDMSFSEEDTGQQRPRPTAPPAEGPPSEALANALRLYERNRHEEACVQLQRVVEGTTRDAPGNVQKAQFFLGKCLYHLRFYQSALAVFDEISQQGQAHLYFAQTLQWLAQLASQLPEPAGIVEKVGRYGADQIEQFNREQTADFYAQLLYMMGRFKYQQGEFAEAVRLLSKVPTRSRFYVNAKFFEGITHVRERRAQPAIRAFRAAINAIENGTAADVQEEDRMLDLAWLSLARVYYSAANRTDAQSGDRIVDGRLLGNAVAAWNKIGVGSEYWLDALFEESWAFFLADEYSRALGNIHTLNSPYFEKAFYPEALVLKAVVFFANCQMENASAMVARFHEQYDPVKAELDAVLARYQDNLQFFEFLKKVREGRAELSPRIRPVVSSALSDRTLLRHLEYTRLLEGEEQRLGTLSREFRNSSLGSRILQDISVAKSFAVDQAGDLARGRYKRLLDELQDLLNQVDTIDVEILSYTRGQLSQELQQQQVAAARSGGGQVEVDEEHQVWPFDGEYWRDELGFYRQQVTSRCGR